MVDKKNSPADTKQQAVRIREAWSNISKDFTYGDMAFNDFSNYLNDVENSETSVNNLIDQLTAARNLLAEKRYILWDKVKRARNGAKARHGDDSSEYERFGSVRMSERATTAKKAKTVKSKLPSS